MAAPLSLPHRLWRTLPPGLRRAAFTRTSAALAPRPDRVAPAMAPGLAVCGELQRASGLGEGARLMLAAAAALNLPVWRIDSGDLASGGPAGPVVVPPEGVPLIAHINAPSLPASLLRLPRALLRRRLVVGYWAWELPVAPPGWADCAGFVHEIWVPSRFTAAALERLAPGRVRVVPHAVGLAPPARSHLTRADFGLPDAAFVVLTSFSLASSFARKNPLAAVAAFRAAFGGRPDCIMVLKLSHTAHWPDDLAKLRAAVQGDANIVVETRDFPAADSHALTGCADAVLSLHRSEGFGLVPAEAMALGKPVVATDWSATAEFIDAGNGMPVPYRLIPAADPRGVFEAPGAMWADADVAAAAAALVALSEDADLRRRLGEAARATIQARFGAAPLQDALAAAALSLAA